MNHLLNSYLPNYTVFRMTDIYTKPLVKKIYRSLLLLCLGLTSVQAQEGTTASGGEAKGSGGSVSYSIGQVVYNTNTGTNGSMSEGIQQPYEIFVVTGLEEVNGINLIISAYPNPTTDVLILKVENYKNENLTYQLYDISVHLLENNKLYTNQTSIVMSNFVSGTYFLKVTENNKEVKTFKIIKN